MVRRIQALNYRCLRHVDVRLDGNFHILVGPNASGKSTLLDVIAFVADLKAGNVEKTVRQRVPDFRDLVWGRHGSPLRFELAVELDAPPARDSEQGMRRYELAVRGDEDVPRIETVQGLVVPASADRPRSVSRFPEPLAPVRSILGAEREYDAHALFRRYCQMLWIGSLVRSGSLLPSLRLHLSAFLRHAVDKRHAGTHQGQQVRPVQPAPPSLRHVQQLVGHQ